MAHQPSTGLSIARVAARWILRLVLLALAVVVAAALAVLVVLPRASHGVALTVLTGSMEPGIPTGSTVLVRPVDPLTLHVGDVATYQKEPGKLELITHRVQGIQQTKRGTEFIFKGDANNTADADPVPASMVRGKVWFHVPYLGEVHDGLHGKGGVALLGMLVLGGYAIVQLAGALKDRRRPRDRRAGVDEDDVHLHLDLDRTLIVATFDTAVVARESDLTPNQAARLWGAILVDQDEQTFRLLIAPPPDGAVAAVELLRSFYPVEVAIWDAPTVLTGRPASPQLRALVEASLRAGAHRSSGSDSANGRQ
jgi:signal peptidase